MHILIAEDDLTTQLLLARTLRRWDYEVTTVADGEAAWEALRTGARAHQKT